MMNLLWRLADVFRIDSIAMNALTGKARTDSRLSGYKPALCLLTRPQEIS
jgi:hypothetical protein